MGQKRTITGTDGTTYEVAENGTLREVQRDRISDRPQTWQELQDRSEKIEATAEVPEELRHLWSDLASDLRADVQSVERDIKDPGVITGYRPPWVSMSLKPAPVKRLTRPRVIYRGVELEPLVVWGADERRIYDDTGYPWGCVCRIETRTGTGSGVLVGPRHVLTASHVIDWNSGSASIEVHRAGDRVQATARATTTLCYTRVLDNDATSLDEDYAVIVTDQRLGDRFGWLGTRTYNSDWDGEDHWHNIGYPDDIRQAGRVFPIHQRDQNLDEDEWDYGPARAMTTSADIMPGQSGSPMFGFWDSVPFVVAVVAAHGSVFASGTENWCSGGNLLTRLVNNARSMHP